MHKRYLTCQTRLQVLCAENDKASAVARPLPELAPVRDRFFSIQRHAERVASFGFSGKSVCRDAIRKMTGSRRFGNSIGKATLQFLSSPTSASVLADILE
jgi:hypothetical protein